MMDALLGTYVEFERKGVDDDLLAGFVLDYNDDLTLINYVDPSSYQADGYSVFRNDLVTSWLAYDNPDYFKSRALRLKGVRPRRPRGIDISCWLTAFHTAAKAFPLVVLHREAMRNDVCNVGRYLGSTAKTLMLYEITSTAEWEKPTRFRVADVTRIDFGGGYEDALWRVAAEDSLPPEVGAELAVAAERAQRMSVGADSAVARAR
jgi:hypothetical protein